MSRAAAPVNDYDYCKNNSIEGAMTAIMADVLQHCFKDEVKHNLQRHSVVFCMSRLTYIFQSFSFLVSK